MNKPPKIVIAPKGCNSYLTKGKEYEVIRSYDNPSKINGYSFFITDNNKLDIYCLEKVCGHINELNWIVKEREK
jgi:hypothetical protein